MKLLPRIFPIVATAASVRFCGPFSASAATNYVAYGGTNANTVLDYNFRPSSLTINVGDTVIWTNAGGMHTVTGLNTNEPLCGSMQNVQACTNTFNIPGGLPMNVLIISPLHGI